MMLRSVFEYFLPRSVRHNKAHPRYDEFYTIASSVPLGILLLFFFPLFLHYIGKPVAGFYINLALLFCTLLSLKWFGHYRIPMSLTAIVTYVIIYQWIRDSGLIYSTDTIILHMYLLGAIWADKRYGWWTIFTNLLLFSFIYYQTIHAGFNASFDPILGSPLYAFGMHALITVFFGVFFAYGQFEQDRSRRTIKDLQDRKISQLDEAVTKRTEQLNTFRQAMATDFHDQTGNMLSAITSQASLLKLKLSASHEVLPIVDSIITNSNELYDSSKDFLWNLNHNSDDPLEVFQYLTGYGQTFYNQFRIPFSSAVKGAIQNGQQLEPFAALNLIYIFKEGMTNVMKHANASEVVIEMEYAGNKVIYSLHDNGRWKPKDDTTAHYGLHNIEKRCGKNKFGFSLSRQEEGTRIEIAAPVKIDFIS